MTSSPDASKDTTTVGQALLIDPPSATALQELDLVLSPTQRAEFDRIRGVELPLAEVDALAAPDDVVSRQTARISAGLAAFLNMPLKRAIAIADEVVDQIPSRPKRALLQRLSTGEMGKLVASLAQELLDEDDQ